MTAPTATPPPPPTDPYGADHDPFAPTDDQGRPRRREKPTASILSQLATLGLIALSWAAPVSAAGSPELERFATGGWIALAVGAAIGTFTPASRPFRRVSAWLGALVVAGFLAFMAYSGGNTDESTWYTVFLAAMGVLGLDLKWVARLRVWVFLSGIFLIPSLVIPGGGQLTWAAGWLGAAFVTLWLLSVDVHRAADRPVDPAHVAEGRPRSVRRPFDLGRILATGLTLGIVGGLLVNSPGYSFEPLEGLVKYLPFRPDIDLAEVDLDLRAYELDDAGQETRYFVTPEGQRFVLSPSDNEVFAVIERDGVDQFVTVDGRVVATIEGASTLHVPSADGTSTTTYHRDDDGWFLASNPEYRVDQFSGSANLVTATNGWVTATDGVVDTSGDAALQAAAEQAGGTLQLPPEAVLEGTVGENTRVWRWDDTVEYDGWRQGQRTYWLGEELEVYVRQRGLDYDLTWTEDRSAMEIYVDEYRQSVTLEIDRDGNAFDYLQRLLEEQTQDESSGDSTSWTDRLRTGAQILLVLAAVAVAAVVLFRRYRARRDQPDRSWAERQVARLDAFGARRTDPRGTAESVVAHLDRLAREVDGGDDRLRDVAEVLDVALYGERPLSTGERRRVERIVDEVVTGESAADDERDDDPSPDRRSGPDDDLFERERELAPT